jgi:hypothetical protein
MVMKIQYTIQNVMTIGRLKINPLIIRACTELKIAPTPPPVDERGVVF